MTEILAFASDHAGLDLKNALCRQAAAEGRAILDLGPNSADSVDYPDYANRLAEAILEGRATRGVLICGSGIGMSIAANRHKGIRAALCWNEETARLSRQHNDANVLCLGARLMAPELTVAILKVFLETPFAGGRHARRVALMG